MRTLVGGVLLLAAVAAETFTDVDPWNVFVLGLVGGLCLVFGDR